MSMEAWLSKHPYLRPVAEFHAKVSDSIANARLTYAHIPNWPEYVDDYKRGIPVLESLREVIDCEEVARIASVLLHSLTCVSIPDRIKQGGIQLQAELHAKPRQLAGWLFGDGDCAFSHPGLLRHVSWTALARYLGPLIAAFEGWRDEESWMQCYCPICGSGPSMGQLADADPRRRLLVCGCCRTRWQFRRIGCPFCEDDNDQQLPSLSIEGEKQLRIDFCHSCSGYLKTYIGEGQESLMLADWSSLHLDFLAQDRGLKRLATSVYEL